MDLEQRIELINQQIATAASKAGRKADDVLLLAVTKKVPIDKIQNAFDLGLTHFGESKVQEAKTKTSQLPSSARWHMIGHLQSNKAREAVRLFDLVHSIDSVALAQEINQWADALGKTQEVLIEVKTSGDSAKFGVKPDALEQTLIAVNGLKRIQVTGLMTMAPYSLNPERARPFFAKLRTLRDEMEIKLGFGLPRLSMGMSGDFIQAIEEGSTIVRIGTSLFGERK
ncbi:MAG: YggS family pyridoxal phosphate-dependent enzyme [Verrucomicrobiota bacterium]|nr:YggS family pyridoxal phosphate-dependent enzyme [Verrucomicrobiota bacterium]